MRKRIYQIIDVADEKDRLGNIYDTFMIVVIIVSLIPLFRPNSFNSTMLIIDRITAFIFAVDYVLRLSTADIKLNKGAKSFLIYPFTPMAIIDIVSILPSIAFLNRSLKLLRVLRLFRALRILRIFKLVRYFKGFQIIINVFKRQKEALLVVCGLAVSYIVICALIIMNVEPKTFPTFFDAVYWATISFTTVGYGDLFAVTPIGKIITMVSSVFGIAIIALPSGIITAGYMEEIKKTTQKDD